MREGGSQHAFWVTLGAGVVGCRLLKKGGALAPECEGLTGIAYARYSLTPVPCKQHQVPLTKVPHAPYCSTPITIKALSPKPKFREMSHLKFLWEKKNKFSANGILNFLPPLAGGAGKARVSSWPETFQSEPPQRVCS